MDYQGALFIGKGVTTDTNSIIDTPDELYTKNILHKMKILTIIIP